MASLQYGSLITGMKGSIHGHTFQGGVASAIVRGKTRFNRNFSRPLIYQNNNTLHSNTQLVSQTWRTLSPTQQAAYLSAAPSFPFKNKWGVTYTPSAYQLYFWQNMNLLSAGESMQTSPPSVVDFPSLAGLALTVSSSASYTVSWSTSFASGFKLLGWVALGCSPGISNPSGRLKYVGFAHPSGTTSINIYSLYVSAFGAPITGQKYFCKVKMVSQVAGSSSAFFNISTIST